MSLSKLRNASVPPPGFLSPESLLAAIVDSSDDAIVSKNLQGVVTSWNIGAERIFGYTAEEMVDQSILKLLPPDRLGEEADILARIQRGERVDHFETLRVSKDGRKIHVSLCISPVRNADGKIVGASKIARDITGQKQAAERLAEAHVELKRADRMKRDFISTLSHELRTPLTAVMGWLQILRDTPTAEELVEGVAVIERNIRAQADLVDDLLDMSRIEAGKLTLDVRPLNLSTTVAGVLESMRLAAEAKGIKLSASYESSDVLVMGDEKRLQQIVWNLVNNAVKFTPKKGHAQLSVQRVESHVEIRVADTGIGFLPEFQRQIFDRFTQEDSRLSRKYGGLGLGLSIVKHLTELHGGTVHAYSPGLDQGALFTVILPLMVTREASERFATSHREMTEDGSLTETRLDGVRVLAVDDDADAGDVVGRILRRAGADVRIAQTMDDALAAFPRFQPHVILSDLGMPGHDGYEFLAHLRALPGGAAVPAVALTALARSEDRTRALRAGFQMHVGKPVEAPDLLALIHNLASLRRDS